MLMPDLERDLVQAAARAGSRQRRRTGLMAACGMAAAAAAAIVALAVVNDSNEPGGQRSPPSRPAPAARCVVGKQPPGARAWRRFDERRVRSLTVLGCARLEDGRRIELVVRRFRPRGRCFDLHVIGTPSVSECAAAPLLDVRPPWIAVSSFTVPGTKASERLGGALAVGWATGDVARVELRAHTGSAEVWRKAALIRVTTLPLVLAAGEHTPFGVFVFTPAKRMPPSSLVGLGANGKQLGVAALPRALTR